MHALWDFRFCPSYRPKPLWAWTHGLNDMRINEAVRKSVLFLGILDARGGFVPYGSGFLVLHTEDEVTLTYLVTAKHVLDAMKESKRPISARVNMKNGQVAVGGIEDCWQTHTRDKNCDIAVASFVGSFDTFDIRAIELNIGVLTEEYIRENDVGAGDDVTTVGLLTAHFGTTRNIPVCRTGNIATMLEEPVDLGQPLGSQHVFLIESRSIGGLSGSPVFLQMPPVRRIRGKDTSTTGHLTEYLMGVNIGLFRTAPHADSVPSSSEERREAFLDVVSSGIAIVVPIQRAIEIIEESQLFRQQRNGVVENMKKDKTFVPTSAAPKMMPTAVPTEPASDNPSHKEDFTSLLSAAAKVRSPKDQT